MKIFHGLHSTRFDADRSVLTIGNFDGVHRGHQQLLAQGAACADQRRAPLVALTFDPHPLAVLRPDIAPERLMAVSDKLDALKRHDVDAVVVARTTPELLRLEAEEFIRLLVEKFRPTHIIEGATFGFGRNRQGTPETLRRLGEQFEFQARIIDPVRLTLENDQEVTVSSSVIRQLLKQGKVHLAALCIGRPYTLSGTVVAGDGRGKKMGFPTANISGVECLIPTDGVYAGAVLIGGARRRAAISIGSNPTFAGRVRKVEAHLLDFHEDVAGQNIHLEFTHWLRPQRSFQTPGDLAEQIAADVQAVRAQEGSQAPAPLNANRND